jgi:Outer membrane protein beta-barrel domain
MKGIITLAAVFVTTLSVVAPAHADATGNVNFFLGQKSLSSSDWEPVEKQGEFGAVMSFGEKSWPISIAVDVLLSAAEEDAFDPFLGSYTITGTTYEVDFGVRKVWGKAATRPYIGGGLAVIGAGAELDNGLASVDADDSAVGFWADAGIFWRLGSHFNLGLDLRYSDADVDLDFGAGLVAQDIGAGGFSYGLLLGFGW